MRTTFAAVHLHIALLPHIRLPKLNPDTGNNYDDVPRIERQASTKLIYISFLCQN